MTAGWLQIGELYREHGVRGEAKLYLYGATDDSLQAAKRCRLLREDGEQIDCRVTKIQPFGRYFLARFDVFKAPEEILPWRKAGLFIPREAVAVESDEMLDADWAGFEFCDENGQALGEIIALDHVPQPMWLVRGLDGNERLVPYVLSWVVSFDKKKKTITVRLPEGLWQLD